MAADQHAQQDNGTLRVAAMSDVHYNERARGHLADAFARASAEADVLLLCGDLTDYGKRAEAEVLAEDLHEHVTVPMLGVLGNHDFESEDEESVWKVMEDVGVTMLDGACAEVDGVGFAGACGFGGGFGERMLNAWGEPLIKAFVQAAIDEALKLERALAQLDTEQRVVLLHYSPIRATVEGEPLEIFPFLGSSRLEAVLDRFSVTAAFHGHAHKGAPEGRTTEGVPVYNVSVPVLQSARPDEAPYRIIEVDRPKVAAG